MDAQVTGSDAGVGGAINRRRTPQGDAESMTKKQVLDFKPAPRLEQVDHEHFERGLRASATIMR